MDFDRHLPTPGSWAQPSNFWILDFNFQIPTSLSWKARVGNPTSDRQSPEVGFQFPTSNREALRPCGENYKWHLSETTTKPVANKPSRGRGPLRVLTGPHGSTSLFQTVFLLENYRFSAFLDTFLRVKSIGAASHLRILLIAIPNFRKSEV